MANVFGKIFGVNVHDLSESYSKETQEHEANQGASYGKDVEEWMSWKKVCKNPKVGFNSSNFSKSNCNQVKLEDIQILKGPILENIVQKGNKDDLRQKMLQHYHNRNVHVIEKG